MTQFMIIKDMVQNGGVLEIVFLGNDSALFPTATTRGLCPANPDAARAHTAHASRPFFNA